MPVRALQRVATVASATAPYNTIQLKLFYPALDATTEEHYQTGVLPFDTQFSPAPVVIFLPGVNCSAHTYEWLATNLAENGIVTVIASWLAQNLPGRFSISPGIDLDAVHVDNYGTRPTSSSLQTIIDALKTLSSETVLAGNVRGNFIFGGHSAGGTMALQNARHDWFPEVIGAFSCCANPLATSVLGNWGKGNIPPLPTDVPVFMIGVSEDGIGDHHVKHFGNTDESGADYIRRIFNEANYTDGKLHIFDGANHHTICHPADHSIGRIFMDSPATGDESAIRQQMSQMISDFVHETVTKKTQIHEKL